MKYLAIDTETTGLDLHKDDRAFAVSAADEQGNDYYWEWDVDIHTRATSPPRKVVQDIKSVIKSHDRFVFHNSTFDLWALNLIGISIPFNRIEDTACTSHVLFSNERKALKYRALVDCEIGDADEKELKDAAVAARRYAKKHKWGAYSNENSPEQDYWMPRQVAEHAGFDEEHPHHAWHSVCRKYAVLDAVRTIALWVRHKQWLLDEDLYEIYNRERQLIPVIYRMKRRGVTLLQENLHQEITRYQREANQHLKQIEKLFPGLNPNSGKQLQELLFDQYQLPVNKLTQSGNPSTDESVLTQFESSPDVPKKVQKLTHNILEYKVRTTAVRYLTNYLNFQKTWKLYPGYNQNGTKTVRLSCQRPNTQNVSKGKEFEEEDVKRTDFKLRSVFGPRKHRIWYPMDYSQLQLRIFAYLTSEQSMLDAFEAGYDFHAFVTSKIFGCHPEEVSSLQRRIGKTVNFGFIFGAQPAKIEEAAGHPGLWEVVTTQFPSAHAYMESVKRQVRKHGYVTTPKGYRLWIPIGDRGVKSHAGVNYIVQGCEGDIVKDAMISCHQYLDSIHHSLPGKRPFITMQVHDELVFDFPKTKKRIVDPHIQHLKTLMEEAGTSLGMKTPVDIEVVTNNWAESESYE